VFCIFTFFKSFCFFQERSTSYFCILMFACIHTCFVLANDEYDRTKSNSEAGSSNSVKMRKSNELFNPDA
jgi:hypothetical protein